MSIKVTNAPHEPNAVLGHSDQSLGQMEPPIHSIDGDILSLRSEEFSPHSEEGFDAESDGDSQAHDEDTAGLTKALSDSEDNWVPSSPSPVLIDSDMESLIDYPAAPVVADAVLESPIGNLTSPESQNLSLRPARRLPRPQSVGQDC